MLGEIAVLVACAAAAFTAWHLTRLRPYYRPVARLLAANLAADLAGLAIFQLYLYAIPAPYTGVARLLFHGEQAAGLAWHVGVAAVALVVLARRSPWPAFVAGAVAVVVRVALYPWLRQERLAWLLLGEQVALVALGIWAWRRFSREARPVRIVHGEPREMPSPWLQEHHKALGVILAVEFVMLFGPHLIGVANGDGLRITPGNPFKRWVLAQIGYTALFTGLAIQHWRWRWRAFKPGK